MVLDMIHAGIDELEAELDFIRQSPPDGGAVELIVRRPDQNEREVLVAGELTRESGLVGDNWGTRGGAGSTASGPHPDRQIAIMNARVIAAVARSRERWQLAGDQLYLDLDLRETNVPPGTRLALGSAVLEVTAEPHTGCKKFAARFGQDALRVLASPAGQQLRLRGIYAKVMVDGTVRVRDRVRKL
ncbi:MAG: MOSC domain-containing protein [Candidatus Schekmanbacteria bacterium]|nr:MOSC domain-containing protein [Candidatus Schekmanbacteria bacterium]